MNFEWESDYNNMSGRSSSLKLMMRFARIVSLVALFSLVFSTVGLRPGFAADGKGQLSGLILGESGQPISDVLVSILHFSSDSALPILTRTNESGRILLQDLDSGTYQILVRSAEYRSPIHRLVEIIPGRTAVVTLILQQMFGAEGGQEEHLSMKALFRSSGDKRLVFRQFPDLSGPAEVEGAAPLFQEGVFQVYSNAGFGGDFLVFPNDSWAGTSTNFAVSDTLIGGTDYVFAGQLSSGQDSLWRFRNFFNYDFGNRHSMRLIFGYGQMNFNEPPLSVLNDPIRLGDTLDLVSSPGTTRIFSLGLEDRYRLNPALSFKWGLDLDQIRTREASTFISPHGEIEFNPFPRSSFRLLASSKRSTVGNTLHLPGGQSVNLANSVFVSRVGDQVSVGQSRHYQGSFTQDLDPNTQVEVAYFENLTYGGSIPVLAVFEVDSSRDLLHLADEQTHSNGYRVSVRRTLTEHVDAEVSYVRGGAFGLTEERNADFLTRGMLGALLERQRFHAFSTQVEAYVPASETMITALVKIVPTGHPITTIDAYSDVLETHNKGLSLFIRQMVPVPVGFLGFLGLDAVFPNRLEALLDVRNLLNDDLGAVQTFSAGQVVLVRNPRTIRGGIAVKF